MKIIFLNSFKKDLLKINNTKLKQQIKRVVLDLETAGNITSIQNVKKLKGFSTAYRIRIGDYRLGFYCENEAVELARLVKRNDIYKVFP